MIKNYNLYKPTQELYVFINECNKLNYKNNNSLSAMKFNWCLDKNGQWFATSINNRIVAISGVHEFFDGYRALFRGAELFPISGGLSKNHMNSWVFYYHIPLVNNFTDKPIYITTNIKNDASGKMKKINKLYHRLAINEIVNHKGTANIYNVDQNIWQLNTDKYMKARNQVTNFN
jgi:hypothetical protein